MPGDVVRRALGRRSHDERVRYAPIASIVVHAAKHVPPQLVFGVVCACATAARAQEAHPFPHGLRVVLEAEYDTPTHDYRAIQSAFVNAAVGFELIHPIHLSVYGGLTATAASGYILQYNAAFQNVRYDTTAGGAGPMFLLRCEPFRVGPVTLALDVLGAFVLYDPNFPPGGDVYNFTWRLGGAVVIRVSERVALTAGARWMHVSNGQGLGPQNPSYEAVGFPVGVEIKW